MIFIPLLPDKVWCLITVRLQSPSITKEKKKKKKRQVLPDCDFSESHKAGALGWEELSSTSASLSPLAVSNSLNSAQPDCSNDYSKSAYSTAVLFLVLTFTWDAANFLRDLHQDR